MDLNTQIILAGLFAGVLRSVIGKLETGTEFDYSLLLASLIRNGVLGAIYAYNSSLDPVEAFIFIFTSDKILNSVNKYNSRVLENKKDE